MEKELKILFADDSQTIRELTSHVLEQRGHTIKTVTDGDKAIEFLNSLPPPDLVITDYNMPKMDGLEVLRRIRTDERFKTLQVIVYTTNNYAEFKSEVESLGGVLVDKKADYLLAAVDAIAAKNAKEKGGRNGQASL